MLRRLLVEAFLKLGRVGFNLGQYANTSPTRLNILAHKSRADCSQRTQLSFLDGSLRWNMNEFL